MEMCTWKERGLEELSQRVAIGEREEGRGAKIPTHCTNEQKQLNLIYM